MIDCAETPSERSAQAAIERFLLEFIVTRGRFWVRATRRACTSAACRSANLSQGKEPKWPNDTSLG